MGGMGGIGFTVFFCEYAFKGVKRPFLQRQTGIFGLPKGHCGKADGQNCSRHYKKRNSLPAAFWEKEAQGGLSVAGRCRCLTKDSNTSIEKEGYIPYSLQA